MERECVCVREKERQKGRGSELNLVRFLFVIMSDVSDFFCY